MCTESPGGIEGQRTASAEIDRAATEGGGEVLGRGIELQRTAGESHRSIRSQRRSRTGKAPDLDDALADIPGRSGGDIGRQIDGARAYFIEGTRATRGDQGGRHTRIDADRTRSLGRQDGVDIRRVRRESQHRDAARTVAEGRVIKVHHAQPELTAIRDGNRTAIDIHVRVTVRTGEHQGAAANLREVRVTGPTETNTLGEGAAFRDVDGTTVP